MIFFLGTSKDNIRQAEFTPRTDATPGNWPGIEKCTKASTEKNMIFRTDSHVSTCLKDREPPKMHSIARWCHECEWKVCAAILDAIVVMGHSENNECAALQRDLQRRTQLTCIVARDTGQPPPLGKGSRSRLFSDWYRCSNYKRDVARTTDRSAGPETCSSPSSLSQTNKNCNTELRQKHQQQQVLYPGPTNFSVFCQIFAVAPGSPNQRSADDMEAQDSGFKVFSPAV